MSKKSFYQRVLFALSNPGIYARNLSYRVNCAFEKFKGLDFSRMESARELNLPANSWNYETSGNKYLWQVFKTFSIQHSDSVLDIGCGKGHALYTFAKIGFVKIAGIEFSERLCMIAAQNMRILKQSSIEIHNADAKTYEAYSKFNYFYMYNPFQEEVMDHVIEHIEHSLIEVPRNVTIVYKNPMCHQSIIKNGIFHKVEEFPSEYDHKFFVYKNK